MKLPLTKAVHAGFTILSQTLLLTYSLLSRQSKASDPSSYAAHNHCMTELCAVKETLLTVGPQRTSSHKWFSAPMSPPGSPSACKALYGTPAETYGRPICFFWAQSAAQAQDQGGLVLRTWGSQASKVSLTSV